MSYYNQDGSFVDTGRYAGPPANPNDSAGHLAWHLSRSWYRDEGQNSDFHGVRNRSAGSASGTPLLSDIRYITWPLLCLCWAGVFSTIGVTASHPLLAAIPATAVGIALWNWSRAFRVAVYSAIVLLIVFMLCMRLLVPGRTHGPRTQQTSQRR